MSGDVEADMVYRVVVNAEEQYSIWPAQRGNPAGWTDEGTRGTKEECLRRIEEVWVDMRPLSLRQQMAKSQSSPPMVRSAGA